MRSYEMQRCATPYDPTRIDVVSTPIVTSIIVVGDRAVRGPCDTPNP